MESADYADYCVVRCAMIRKTGVLPPTFILVMTVLGCATPPGPDPAAPPPPTSAAAGGQTIVAIAAPSPPQQTLPQWLGINDMFGALGGLTRAKHRFMAPLFPQMARQMLLNEPPPLLKSITDPDNLKEDAPPVVQAAAEAQMDEQAAEQKIVAIEALAKIGCVRGHPAVEEGLLASLSDPTERVRFAAVSALAELAGSPCEVCQSGSCCSPKIYAQLAILADKKTATDCWYEPSGRVRRLARRAMIACGPSSLPKTKPPKIEGPPQGLTPPKPNIEGPETVPPAPGVKSAALQPVPDHTANRLPPLTPIAKRQTWAAKQNAGKANGTTAQPASLRESPGRPTTDGSNVSAEQSLAGDENSIRIRWERVVAPIANFTSRGKAREAIDHFRNLALGIRSRRPSDWNHKRFVIRVHGWTAEEAVAPSALARLVSALPIGRVSVIIEDRDGFHMVRILERRMPRQVPKPRNGPQAGRQTSPRESVGEAWKLDDPQRPHLRANLSVRRPHAVPANASTPADSPQRTAFNSTAKSKPRSSVDDRPVKEFPRPALPANIPRWSLGESKTNPRGTRVGSRHPVERRNVVRSGSHSQRVPTNLHGASTQPIPSGRKYDVPKESVSHEQYKRAVKARPVTYGPRDTTIKRFPIRQPKTHEPSTVPAWKLDTSARSSRSALDRRSVRQAAYPVPRPTRLPASGRPPQRRTRPQPSVTNAEYLRKVWGSHDSETEAGFRSSSPDRKPASEEPPQRSQQSAKPVRVTPAAPTTDLFPESVNVWSSKFGDAGRSAAKASKARPAIKRRKANAPSALDRDYERSKLGQWNDR